ncbi:unnamed protein product [Ilex paraguariensis]|uniref:Uncharacterized protein n=1 Tax=Ilex paraguariensis TaxID=185542 RepID=A0ABC8RAB8_9AQUA
MTPDVKALKTRVVLLRKSMNGGRSPCKVSAPVGVKASFSPAVVLTSAASSTLAIIYVPPELPELPEAPADSTPATIPKIPKLPEPTEIVDSTVGT